MKLFIFLLIVAACNEKKTDFDPNDYIANSPRELSKMVGRYQYVPQSNGYINRGKLIDTATGRIWQDTCFLENKNGPCHMSAWSEEDVVGITISSEDYWKRVGSYEEILKKRK